MSARYLDGFAAYAKKSTLYQSHQLVLYWLCEGSNDNGLVSVSVGEMQKRTGMGKSTVYGVFQKLEERGVIERLEGGSEPGDREYQILLPVADPQILPEVSVSEREDGRMVYEIHVHVYPQGE